MKAEDSDRTAALPDASASPAAAPAAAALAGGCPNSTERAASAAAARLPHCQYGWQPGLWHESPGDPISVLIQADEQRSLAYESADSRCALKPLAQHYIALSRVQHNNSEENQRALKWTTEQVQA